jgi:hypothetical protein
MAKKKRKTVTPTQALKKTPPWRKKRPKIGKPTKLSPEDKQAAKTRAARAGRPYPNLVDNMWAASRKKKL